MANYRYTVSPEEEKRVKGLGFLRNRGTDNFSGGSSPSTESSPLPKWPASLKPPIPLATAPCS